MPSTRASLNAVAFNAAISACESGGQWMLAVDLLGQMAGLGISCTTVTLGAAISACETSGQWQPALRLFAELDSRCSSARGGEGGLGLLERSVIACNSAISSCAVGAQWLTAVQLLVGMALVRIGADTLAFTAAIRACEQRHQWQAALQLFTEMACREVERDVVTFASSMRACEKAGRCLNRFQTLGHLSLRHLRTLRGSCDNINNKRRAEGSVRKEEEEPRLFL
ncbi:unnamed protein product [Polarella glacialis]|uniref:Pentatricopeptide repeat-containing protein, chloroplastic n=2 Tax=Polarella glacialis TaxID=89957 RepID=A0A813LND4_POLGL|nr:unnamed protein product [Polarella glacialis]